MMKLNNFLGYNIFFVGIGGISMSALAHFCVSFGAKVSGSDHNINDETKRLIKAGIKVFRGHDASHIDKSINLVVYSGAIKEDNPEILKAQERKIPVIERSELLGILAKMYQRSIVITGTHGKTTTTAMISEMFLSANLKPSVHLGGESISFGNFLIGNKRLFISEGCEYRNSIKYLSPSTSVITSIELDHTDFYKSINEIEQNFLSLANNSTDNVIVFENIPFSKKISNKSNILNVGFGEDYDIRGDNLTRLNNGCYSFDVYYGTYIGKFVTNIVGVHNAHNALCAIAVALVYDIDVGTIYNALRRYNGVKRRFEKVGEYGGADIICDYAHHPTEILNSINTAKDIYKNVTVVFQPHTYSRTIGLKQQFLHAFKDVDKLIIYKTFPAREKYIVGGSAKELFNEIKHCDKAYCGTIKNLKEVIKNNKNPVILVLGAGDIYDIIKSAIISLKHST